MRARNIKPAFFKNEVLGLIDPLARLLFIGLWCYCDREGRFEWRPMRIKAEILPYDNCNIDQLLNTLVELDEIKKYKVDQKMYGFIPNFKKHQNPHNREIASICPPFEENHNLGTDEAQPRHGGALLNPESLILNPESLILNPKGSVNHNLGTDEAQPRSIQSNNDITGQKRINYKWFMTFWNTKANSSLNHIKELTEERKRKIKTRFTKKHNFNELFEQAVLKIPTVPFLNGDNNRKWRIDFDWLIANDTNIVKVLEGKYDDKKIETNKNKETKRIEQELIKKYGGKDIAN